VLCLPGRYSVTYLVLAEAGAERAIGVVDVGSADDVPRIRQALRWLGRSEAEVRWVLPSHLHFDHLLGVDPLALAVGSPVALGETGARVVVEGMTPRWPPRLHLLRAIPTWIYQGMPFPVRADWRAAREFGFPWARNRFRAPLVVLRERAPLEGFPGWELLASPGHADDAVCLYHRAARFLISGDNVRNFVGGEWNPLLCSDSDFARSREELLGLEVETVFPAHGPVLEGEGILRRLRTLPWWDP
jgi:glyoxylase-like metal-dependent hydrolase (beta-lactamase superfamily II)